MTTKRRTDYQVDEEALKRMMAGDVTALERTVPPEEEPETKSQAGPCPEKQEKKSGSSRQQIKKTPDGAADSDEYRSRFLKVKLSGARRQTYINDTLYRTVAKVLPAKVLNEFSPLLQEDNLVAIACRLSIREDEAPKILMQSVQLLDEALMAKKEPKRLYIQLETRNDENLKNVEKYLSPYQGDMEVRLFFKDTRKMSSVPRRLWFNGTENAIYDLKNIFGEDNVKIK